MADEENLRLIDDCLDGDQRAWDRLEALTTPVIQRSAQATLSRHGRGGDQDMLWDIIQQVYLRLIQDAYHHLRQFNPDRASWNAWIGMVAHTGALKHLRALPASTTPLDAIPEPIAPDTPISQARVREILERLDGQLTPSERRIAVLLWEEGLSPEEIAKKLQISRATLFRRKSILINKARTLIDDDPENF